MLQPGANALGVMLGNGMYNVEGVEDRYKKFVGTFGQLRLIAQLAITYEDGSREIVGSDDQWRTRPGPTVFSSIFGAVDHHAPLEIAAWDREGAAAEGWAPVPGVAGPARAPTHHSHARTHGGAPPTPAPTPKPRP